MFRTYTSDCARTLAGETPEIRFIRSRTIENGSLIDSNGLGGEGEQKRKTFDANK